jgi:peroxiredoxin
VHRPEFAILTARYQEMPREETMNLLKHLFRACYPAALFILLAGALLVPPAVSDEDQEERPLAPAFSLKDLNGRRVALDDLLGKGPVLIDFWATWCKPCIKELPHLHDMYLTYRDRGFQVVAISEDSPRSLSKVKSFVAGNRYEFLVLLDENGTVQRKFNFRALPYTVLLDRDGRVVHSRMGYRPGDEKVLEEKLVALLQAQEAAEQAGEPAEAEEVEEGVEDSQEESEQPADEEAGEARTGTAEAERDQKNYIKKVKGEQAREIQAEERDE